ncbi:hypothetical protein HPB47_014265 [Ixodes persulcatus]|uniref:Uncharacterized protein n=1 Tax=Ixodes persulcatus TaxID=34615 RepID=A0AC60QWG3_IXOPE|nr:hypothetical protein HPB47_014265 [Ixodes persulcatus]
MFAFHLPRFAVRVNRTLVEIIYKNNVYEREAPLKFSDDHLRKAEQLVRCFGHDLQQLPAGLRGSVVPDTALSRGALMKQTAAVRLAFFAFQTLLANTSYSYLDFHLRELPDLTANQLFYVYYALDNCESADDVYEEHTGFWLPAEYRVNVPLRHDGEFSRLFKCDQGSNMGHVEGGPCWVCKQ